MKKQLLLLILMLLPLMANAYDVEIDGIYYNLDTDAKTAEVTFRDNNYNSYSGSVTIPESIFYSDITYSVTNLSANAFYGCSALTSVNIPYSVSRMGNEAFYGCSALTSIDIPYSISIISENAFRNCTNLTFVDIPSSVTFIGWHAFQNCSSLTSINIPNSVTTIGSYAFYGCSGLTSIEIPNCITYIGSYTFYGCSGLTSITIPNSVTNIGDRAFLGCSGLISIEIPNSVTTIGGYTFQGCTSLTSIEIPNSVTIIGGNAFRGCSCLTSINIPNSVISIGSYAFYECTGLTSVHITDLAAWCRINFDYQQANPLSYAKHLYLNGEEIKNLVIPEGVTRIGGFAFSGCSDITSIKIPNSVSTIGDQAFFGCSGLTSIDIPNSIITIGDYAFYQCSGLTSLVIGNNVTNIGKEAFSGCTSIPSLHIPQSMNSIDESAFNDCTGLVSIVVDSENPKYDSRDDCNAIIETSTNKLIIGCRNTVIPQSVTDYGQYGLANCVKIILPEGIEEIPSLYNCKALESITIPNSVKKINDYSFSGCSSLKNIIIEDGTEELTFETFYTYSGYQSKWYKDNPLDSVYLGRNYKTSYYTYYPFMEHPTLRAVAFGNNVKSIGDCAFRDCRNLQSIKLGSNIETIGFDAFWNSSKLDTIIIPSGLKAIGSNAFYCPHISTLIIEDGEDLDLYNGQKGTEFKGSSIDSLYLGRSNVNIVSDSIKHVTIGKIKKLVGLGGKTINVLDIIEAPDTLRIPVYQNSSYAGGRVNYYYTTPFSDKTIDSLYCNRIVSVYDTYNENSTVHPFEGVTSSFKLEIGKNLTEIGDGMFYGCKIPSLFIPNNIKHISPTAFNNCYTLNSLTIEDGTEPLDFGDGNNFYGCQLRDVYIGRNMQYTTDSPFNRNREGLKILTIGDNVTELGDKDFFGHVGLKSVTFSNCLKRIGYMAFYGCDNLTTLSIPGSVIEIGKQAFDLCRSLKTLAFEDGTETLVFTAPENNLNDAFQNSPIENIYLGRNISFSNSSPFSIIETLKTLTIGNEVTHVANKAFIGCPNLKDVTSYAKTVPTTGEVVFTPSYLPSATLHVPYELYNQYKVAPTWKDFGNIKNFEGLYNLTYMVDGEIYKDSVVEQNSPITPEAEPTKDYYTFSGWSEVPDTMPDHDVTITGSFIPNKYKLIYQVDGVDYVVYDVAYGSAITPETDPIKEGYTFSGWSEVPDTMPGHDVTVTGSFAINSYLLTYSVDGEIVKSDSIAYNTVLTPIEDPTKEGYTFSGWSDIPETMPAHDVTVTGSFSVNSYTLTYMVDDKVYKETMYEYGATIIPEPQPEGDYATFEWTGLPENMPAHDVVVYASYTTGIIEVLMATQRNLRIYSPNGKKLNKLQKGLNILVLDDGTIKKVIVK